MAHGAQIDLRPSRAAQRTGALVAIALHAAVVAALVTYTPARSALLSVAPIMVSLITPLPPEAKPVETPPTPKPVAKPRPKPAEPQARIAAPVEVPSPSPVVVTPPPPPTPLPAVPQALPQPQRAITAPIFAADYLDNPPPSYPALSRRAHEQGRVVLRVLVNPGGRADNIEIRSSSGHLRLDEAARDTVRRWRFVPAKRGDEPVPAWVLIPVSFSLEG
jgi:periplasmic protein TonB